MVARLRSWWQQVKQHRVTILFVSIILVVAIALIIAGYWFDWTGFNGYNKITVAHTFSGTNAGTVTKTEEYQPGKGLWDWLQLLIIPAVLAVAGYVINLTISRSEQEATKQRAQSEREAAEKHAATEREIALDNQRESALQRYIDNMSELLSHENLRKSKEDAEVRTIARVRTLTVLPRLDGKHKGSVIQFLYESALIDKNRPIVDLNGADLSRADLKGLNLIGANLIGANLNTSSLSFTELSGADLRKANLEEANLIAANLEEADLGGPPLIIADVNIPVLSGANLLGALLMNARLERANLSRAVLFKANLAGSDLMDANLSSANLISAFLEEADLRRAILEGANLEGAFMKEADLEGANLKDVIGITIEELEKEAKSLRGATMPDGSIHR